MPKTALSIFIEWTKNSSRAHGREVSDDLDGEIAQKSGLEVEGTVL